MIKINLLSTEKKGTRKTRKVTEFQQQSVLGALILGLALMGMWFYYDYLNTKINNLIRDKAAAEARIREQDNMLKEVKMIEEERKKVLEKIAIVEQLKTNRTLLVHLVDEVSKALPVGVNVVSLSEQGGNVAVDGTAFTNHDVVRFIDNLKGCQFMSDVFLQETVQSAQEGIEIYRYKLRFTFKGV